MPKRAQRGAFTPTSIAVAVPVSRWATTLAWYQDVLGCRPVRVEVRNGEVVEMRFGAQRFSLWLDWGDPRIPLASNDQARTHHLLLGVKSLARARRALISRGASLARTGSGLFDCVADPEGNQILLFEEQRKRSTPKEILQGLAHLREMEIFRVELDEQMRDAGVTGFDTVEARAAFLKARGLKWPRSPRIARR